MSVPALLQIVPHGLQGVEGVGAYAAALGRALAERGVASRFLVGEPGPAGAGGEAEETADRRAGALTRQLAASGIEAVLVHYVNYGYERRGRPRWLVEGVERWRRAAAGRRLLTFFHEVYASGPPWRRTFWLSPGQRRLAARLLGASDAAGTSLPLYGRLLAGWRPRREVWVAPVFSPVGEPAAVPSPEGRRPRRMLVFGGLGNRRRVYRELRAELGAACRALAVEEVADLGPPLGDLPAEVEGLPVRALGPRRPEEVSALLLGSYAGFLGYPAAFLGKSTVFAAYCAHGLVPVCAWPSRLRRIAGERLPFWAVGEEPAPTDAPALAGRARAWYAEHALPLQAGRLRALLADLTLADCPAESRQCGS